MILGVIIRIGRGLFLMTVIDITVFNRNHCLWRSWSIFYEPSWFYYQTIIWKSQLQNMLLIWHRNFFRLISRVLWYFHIFLRLRNLIVYSLLIIKPWRMISLLKEGRIYFTLRLSNWNREILVINRCLWPAVVMRLKLRCR